MAAPTRSSRCRSSAAAKLGGSGSLRMACVFVGPNTIRPETSARDSSTVSRRAKRLTERRLRAAASPYRGPSFPAEQNALLTAARFGISVEGSDVYTTLAPCFGCMKELLQAKVRSVYYLGDFKVDAEHRDQLDALIARFRDQKGRVKKLVVPGVDPNLGRSGPETIEDTGHTMPAA